MHLKFQQGHVISRRVMEACATPSRDALKRLCRMYHLMVSLLSLAVEPPQARRNQLRSLAALMAGCQKAALAHCQLVSFRVKQVRFTNLDVTAF